MSAAQLDETQRVARADWAALMNDVGPRFAARAADYDTNDNFVAEN